MCKINGHFAKKLSTTSQIIGGGSANPFFYIVFTAAQSPAQSTRYYYYKIIHDTMTIEKRIGKCDELEEYSST